MITVKSFEFNFFQENTYLVYDETGEAVLIDCQMPTDHLQSLGARSIPRQLFADYLQKHLDLPTTAQWV